MKHIVSISFGSARQNHDSQLEFRGENVRISQFGANCDVGIVERLIRKFDGQCDVIALTGLQPPIRIGQKTYLHRDSQRLMSLANHTPVTSGCVIRDTIIPWTIQKEGLGERLFRKEKVLFTSGLAQFALANAVSEYTNQILFADPLLHLNVPVYLRNLDELTSYGSRLIAKLGRFNDFSHIKKDIKLFPTGLSKHNPRAREAITAGIVVSSHTLLERYDLSGLRGKVIVVDTLPEDLEKRLHQAGIHDIVYFLPSLPSVSSSHRLGYAVWEALLQLELADDECVEEDDVLDLIEETKMNPRVQSTSRGSTTRTKRFAFIIHPLSANYLFYHPALKPLRPLMQPMRGPLEKAASLLPGVPYGRVTGVESEYDGTRVEGIVYTLFDTPKQLLQARPEAVYQKLVKVCERAARDGAEIIGLGAFTKIVGDAGVTVAGRSPIPVTTGNSLSAASSLWAARVACEKLGFLPAYHHGQRMEATAMVVGATGSIGAVTAKLLARVASRLILTAPRSAKLLKIRDQIEAQYPEVEVKIATNNDRFLPECDLIVISTSSPDGNVFDLSRVRPGAVICDVSRPLSFTAEHAATRPDVMIVESGEIVLPGDVQVNCDLGLTDNIVYACLGETALLALEGRFENYTLSRTISEARVNEIYDLAKRHGAKLANIRGPMGLITDQEIALCREHAQKALEQTVTAQTSPIRMKG